MKKFIFIFVVFSLVLTNALTLPRILKNEGKIQEVHQQHNNSIKIVGGIEATPHEFPWIVAIQDFIQPEPNHLCGGTIINPEWVVTAGHCTIYMNVWKHQITAGEHNIYIDEGVEQIRTVIRYYRHPNYIVGRFKDDIALLRVFPPFEFNEYVSGVKIPEVGFQPTVFANVSGWGDLYEGDNYLSNVLMKVGVPLITDATCKLAYGDSITESMICYGEGGKDSCQGDSGGSLIAWPGQELVGIVSWGSGCARPEYPGVYTKVSHFNEWVRSYTDVRKEDDNTIFTQTNTCGGILNYTSSRIDFFSTTTLPKNSKCSWTISTSLTRVRFHISRSGSVTRNDLFVTDWEPITNKFGSTISLFDLNDDYNAVGPIVILTLINNGEELTSGFEVEYFASGFRDNSRLSENKNLVEENGFLSYPESGGSYINNDRSVIVFNPPARNATIRWIKMDTESEDQASLYIWENNTYKLIADYSGREPPAPNHLTEGLGLILFSSDSGFVFDGFALAWYSSFRQEDTVPILEQKDTCGGILESSSGNIDFFSSSTYKVGSKCSWIIQTSLSSIRLRILKGGLAPGDCIYFTEWDPTTQRPGITKNITAIGQDVIINGPAIIITFSSNSDIVGLGFVFQFYGSGIRYGDTELITYKSHLAKERGTFAYPIGGGLYGYDERTLILLNPDGTGNASVDWTKMSLSTPRDIVSLYIWERSNFTFVASYTGSRIPQTSQIPEGLALFVFVSDGSGQNLRGFDFTWYRDLLEEDPKPILEQKNTCGGILNSTSGRIDYYSTSIVETGTKCTWILQTDLTNLRVKIIESNIGQGNKLFLTNWLDSKTKYEKLSTQQINSETNILVNGSIAFITLTTTLDTIGNGFIFEFYGSGKLENLHITHKEQIIESTGSFSYPSNGEKYQNNEKSIIVFNPNGAKSTVINWTKMDLQEGGYCTYDTLVLYVWEMDEFKSVYPDMCGTNIPLPVSIQNGLGMLLFFSDDIYTGTGFSFDHGN